MRLFVLTFALFISTTASATTIGDAFELVDRIKVEADRRCPEGKSVGTKCHNIEILASSFLLKLEQFGERLLLECKRDIQAGKLLADCRIEGKNYRQVVLTADDEQAYLKLKEAYEDLLRD